MSLNRPPVLKSLVLQAIVEIMSRLLGKGHGHIDNAVKSSPPLLRTSYYNDRNRELVKAAQRGDYAFLIRWLVAQDSEHPGLYHDETIESRVGLALIFKELEGATTPLHIVDVAAGNCQLIMRLAELGHQVTGVDASPLRVLQNRAQIPGLQFGVAEDLPIADRCADIVIATEMLEHVFDPVKTVREIWRILKVNGKVYCQVPYLDFADGVNHLRHFDDVTLQGIFIRNGFANLVVTRVPYLVDQNPNTIFLAADKITSD